MKRLLFLVASFQTLCGYTIKISNGADKPLSYEIDYWGATAVSCRTDKGIVSPGQERDVKTGSCCWKKMWLEIKEGADDGRSFSWGWIAPADVRVAGNSCRNEKIGVKKVASRGAKKYKIDFL